MGELLHMRWLDPLERNSPDLEYSVQDQGDRLGVCIRFRMEAYQFWKNDNSI